MAVTAILGNVFEGGADLTVLPCSAKPSVSKFTRNWIETFGLVDPVNWKISVKHGEISRLYKFRHKSKRTRYYCYAAAVLNDYSSADIVKGIAREIGLIAATRPDIKNIECVLLGTGAGGLSNEDSAIALKSGFESTAPNEARLIICANNANVLKSVENSISGTLLEKIASRIKLSPSFFGMGLDLDKDKMSIAKWMSRFRFFR